MIVDETVNKLRYLHLDTMADKLVEILENREFDELSFDEKIAMIVDCEWSFKESKKINRLGKYAGYAIPEARIEAIEYTPERELKKVRVAQLSLCTYIQKAENIIITGATGTGKTYLACALGRAANKNSFKVRYYREDVLEMELVTARMENTYAKKMNELRSLDLLIIDEWLTYPVSETGAQDIQRILDSRYMHHSTIVCTQLKIDGWFERVGDKQITDAICDRLVHNAYKINLKGNSMRKVLHSLSE